MELSSAINNAPLQSDDNPAATCAAIVLKDRAKAYRKIKQLEKIICSK